MEKQKSWKRLFIGGVAATAMVAGVAAFTLAPSAVSAQEAEQSEGQGRSFGFRGHDGERESGERGSREHGFGERGDKGADRGQYLADALGITVDELDAAQAAVAEAAIAQGVADGDLTQEQADRIAERAGDFGGRMPMMGGHGGFGKGDADHDALLAAELGISVEALQAAQDEAKQAGIDQSIADGNLTAEEADLMVAGQALREYIDHEAIMEQVFGMSVEELKEAHENGEDIRDLFAGQGLDRAAIGEAMQAAQEDAIAQALADGVITQDQADALQDSEGFGGRGGAFPGRGGRGGQGFPGMGPGGFERGNGESSTPSEPVESSRA